MSVHLDLSWIKKLPAPRGGYAHPDRTADLCAAHEAMCNHSAISLLGKARDAFCFEIPDGPTLRVSFWGKGKRELRGDRLIHKAASDMRPEAVFLERTIVSALAGHLDVQIDAVCGVTVGCLSSLAAAGHRVDARFVSDLCAQLEHFQTGLGREKCRFPPPSDRIHLPFIYGGELELGVGLGAVSSMTDRPIFIATSWGDVPIDKSNYPIGFIDLPSLYFSRKEVERDYNMILGRLFEYPDDGPYKRELERIRDQIEFATRFKP